jgi:4-amino-4-deoxy-L-arabinose transferase-like glycosyltransferase
MRTALFLTAFVILYLALQLGSIRANSVTFDEPLHLTAGYLALTRGDYGFDTTHPPLLRMWAALPLLATSPREIDLSARQTMTLPAWTEHANNVAAEFVFNRPDVETQLGRARLMTSLLGVGLGLLLYAWVREWLGHLPAAVILACYAIAPNLAAHAGLVTTDFGLTLFFFAACYFLWRLNRGFTGWNLAGLGVAFALALASKYSAVILAPVAVLLLGLAAAAGGGEITWRRAGLAVLVLAFSGIFGVWAVYRFQYAPAPGMAPLRADVLALTFGVTPVIASVFGWVDAHRLLPSAYSQGFIWSQASASDMGAYLLGQYRTGGWWYYFPVAMVLKTTVGKLILVFAGAFLLVRRRLGVRWIEAAFILVPPLAFLGCAMASDINIGVRHVLPVSAFGFLLAALTVRHWMAGSRFVRSVLALVVALWTAGFAAAYPYPLTFFNLAVGGSAKGPKYLADSNLDWGQGLKALKVWMEKQGVAEVNFAYFGLIDPENYGIRYVGLPTQRIFEGAEPPRLPGYVVLSPTVQAMARREPRLELFYEGIEDRKPLAVVGHALRIYWCDEWPLPDLPDPANESELKAHLELADALLGKLGWPAQAAKVYRQYLEVRPGDSDATANLAVALFENGQAADALASFDRAVSLDSNPHIFSQNVARYLLSKKEYPGAEAFARRAVALDSSDGRAREILGLILAAQSKFRDAEVALVESLRLEPNSASAAALLGRVRSDLARSP